jgi:hypothetical protein
MFGGGFSQFRCRTSPIPKTGVGVHTKHKFLPPEPILRFSQRTCPIRYFRSKTHVWGGFTLYRCRTSPIPKTGVGCIQSTSFCHRNYFFVFRNEQAQSTTLGPKLMFGVVSRNFVAARHPLRKRVSGCIQSTSFRHRNQLFVFRNEHAQCTTFGKNSCLGWFRVISLPHVTHSENGCRVHTKREFSLPEPFLCFSQRTCPIHYFRSKTHAWGGFAQFRCRTSPIPKTGVEVHTKHEFFPPEPILRFSQRTCPIHYFRSKTHVWGGFALFFAARHPFRKRVRGANKARVFATETNSSFFATNMPNPLL